MMFQPNEVVPQCFYFTYSLQEHERFVDFLENSNSDTGMISDWSSIDDGKISGKYKILDSEYSKYDKPIDHRNYYIVNSLWSTMKWCVNEYCKFNNIKKNYTLDKKFKVYKVEKSQGTEPRIDFENSDLNKLSIKFFLNDSYMGGEMVFPEYHKNLKPEAGSIVVYKSASLIHGSSPLSEGAMYYAEIYADPAE